MKTHTGDSHIKEMHLAVLCDLPSRAVKDIAAVIQPLPLRFGNRTSDEIYAVLPRPGGHALHGLFMPLRQGGAEVAGGIGAAEHFRQHGKIRAALRGAPHEGGGLVHGLCAVELGTELAHGDLQLVVHSVSRYASISNALTSSSFLRYSG